MGDSSVSCVLTGMSLTYEPAVLIALAPARYSKPSRKHPSLDHGARICTNEGACAVFAPVMLPIFGKMDSYGNLEQIEENEHTKFLEARLKMPIEKIARYIAGGHKIPALAKFARKVAQDATDGFEKQMTWDGRLYGCFVAREAWDAFSADFIDECGRPEHSVWDAGWLDAFVLRGLGFVKGPKDEPRARAMLGNGPHQGDRYNTPYTHPQMPDVIVWCDETMSSTVTVGGKDLSKLVPIFHPSQMQAALRKYKRELPEAAVAWAKATPMLLLKFAEVRRKRNRALKMDRADLERCKQFPETTFHLIADTTPQEIREATHTINQDRFQRNMQKFLREEQRGEPASSEQLELALDPKPAPVPEGATQTFCDSRKHVTLTATAEGKASNPLVCDCEGAEVCKKARYSLDELHSERLAFTPEALEALRANGWTLKQPYSFGRNFDDPYLRGLAPEAMYLYRGTVLREFVMQLVGLTTFTRSMYAANRLFQPTAVGYQYGHLPMQRKVAQLTTRVLSKRIAAKRAAMR